ncbi:MAG: DUF4339 domain-containing protein [Spirochaetaceae bacterium]|nr:DUF4339 domain-containing protein [Spirochaetaceae bacterium]
MNNQNNANFFSMDRLVEFGMGMAMSQQIAKSMNEMMASIHTPPQMQVAAQPLYAMPTMQTGMPVQPTYRQSAASPIAQQQVSSSPAAMANQNPAGVNAVPAGTPQTPPPLPVFPEVYYVVMDGKQTGPYSGTEIARLVMEKKVTAKTYTWKGGMPTWKFAEEFPELLCLISMVPPELPKENSDAVKEAK